MTEIVETKTDRGPRYRKRTNAQIVAEAMELCSKDDYGSVDEAELIEVISKDVKFDEKLKITKAAQIVRSCKAGGAVKDGQYTLPGMSEGFAYQPGRLVANDHGRVVPWAKATPAFLVSHSRRSRKNADNASKAANVWQATVDAFNLWALNSGLPSNECVFERFIIDTGVWKPGDAKVIPADSDGDAA